MLHPAFSYQPTFSMRLYLIEEDLPLDRTSTKRLETDEYNVRKGKLLSPHRVRSDPECH